MLANIQVNIMKKTINSIFVVCLLTLSLSLLPGLASSTLIEGTTGTLDIGTDTTASVTQVNSYQVSWDGNSYLTAGTGSGQDLINQNYTLQGEDDVHLASLSWKNDDNLKDKTINLAWEVTLNLSDPILNATLQRSSLNLLLVNGNGSKHLDTLTLEDLSGLSLSFGVWNVTNLHYMLDSPSDDNVLNGLNWTTTKSKGQENRLWIVADIKDPPSAAAVPSSVPEPSTFILFGAGLLGVGFLKKRYKK